MNGSDYDNGFFRDFCWAKFSIISLKSMFWRISLSMHIIDKLPSRSCNIVVRNSFFILLSCENYRSPLQLVTIKQRNILVEIFTFGKVSSNLSAFIKLCKVELFKSSDCFAMFFKYWLKWKHSVLNSSAFMSSWLKFANSLLLTDKEN